MGVLFKVFKNLKVHPGIKRTGQLYYTLLIFGAIFTSATLDTEYNCWSAINLFKNCNENDFKFQ